MFYGNASGAPHPIAPLSLATAGSLWITRPLLDHYLLTAAETQIRADEVYGLAASGAIANPIFYLVLLSGAFQVGGKLSGFTPPPAAHYRLTTGPMIATALAYVACIGSLVAGMALNNVGRKSPRRIEAEERGEVLDRAPGHSGDGVYDDYFAEFASDSEFDDSDRGDDRWGG